MIYAITCGDKNYYPSMKFHLETAKRHGKVDRTVSCRLEELDAEFVEKNKKIFDSGKGYGCFIWKPYCILKVLDTLKDGDFLIYLDSAGFYYASSVKPAVRYMEKHGHDIMCVYQESNICKCWTKRDTFVLMGCDEPKYTDAPQCQGGNLLIKKTDHSVSIIREWLKYSENYNIICDSENICGLENYAEFQQHRHDQSILSILCVKHNIPDFGICPVTSYFVYHHSPATSVRSIKSVRLHGMLNALKKRSIKEFFFFTAELLRCYFLPRAAAKKLRYLKNR